VGDQVSVGATLTDSDGAGVPGRSITFQVGTASASGTTDALGHASATLTLAGPAGSSELTVAFAGDASYGPAGDSTTFTVTVEDTTLTLPDAVGTKKTPAVATATLAEADGGRLPGRTIQFFVEEKVRNVPTFVSIGTAVTNANGVATFTIPTKYVSTAKRPIRAVFAGDSSYAAATGNAFVYRN
jgi:hypothetical protein